MSQGSECNKRQKIVKRPSGEITLRCMNKACGLHGQTVEECVCERCPVRSVKHVKPCGQRTPQPIARPQEDVNAVEILGMKETEVRELMQAAGMDVADLDVPESPEYPSFAMQMWTYKEALLKWNKAGRPVRSKEEVARLNEICKKCDWHDPEQKRCRGCGCAVSVSSIAVFNKLKMATEHCPKENF